MVGKWQDILVHAKWSKKDDGFFKVFVNDELKYNYEGRTQSKYRGVFYQFGVYRTGVSKYLNYHNVPGIRECLTEKGQTDEEYEIYINLYYMKKISLKNSRLFYEKCKEHYKPVAVPTTVVYFDEVRKGRTKEDVTIGLRSLLPSNDESTPKVQSIAKPEYLATGRD